MRKRWYDRITNQKVVDWTNLTSIEAIVLKTQLRWTGHVIRMDTQRIPRQVLYGELASGSRKHGQPKTRFKDQLKANLKLTNLKPKEHEPVASDRSSWSAATQTAANAFENDRRHRLEVARVRLHLAAADSHPPSSDLCSMPTLQQTLCS
ncbi:uncharacterized protein LOC143039278 [Oratosquilla oratoria]|uniref:uncharacterized protein LOC143039278 n=1 Tax=Oratosquilla oratoria TaxID=337810 RepID=UPI003F76ACE4